MSLWMWLVTQPLWMSARMHRLPVLREPLMTPIWDALAHLIDGWGWLLILGVFFGGGDVLARILDGRRKRAILKAQNTTLKAENQRLNNQLTMVLERGGDPSLIKDDALQQNGQMLDILSQVQASDQAFPQLPQPVRDRIDGVLDDRWSSGVDQKR